MRPTPKATEHDITGHLYTEEQRYIRELAHTNAMLKMEIDKLQIEAYRLRDEAKEWQIKHAVLKGLYDGVVAERAYAGDRRGMPLPRTLD